MAQTYIKNVMESMGWTDGSFLPIANDENKKIMELIAQMNKDKVEKSILVKEAGARVENIQAHILNSEQEVNQNLKLLNAHRSQLERETHLFKLAEHEKSRLQQQNKEVEKSIKELSNYDSTSKKEIEKINNNVEKMVENIKWVKTALNEWHQVMDRGEEANALIAKYCKIDANKAEALESKRKNVQIEICKKKAALNNAYNEQKTVENILQRTAQLYRQAHAERRTMVNTWKEAVNQMNQREKDLIQAELDLESAKRLSNVKNLELKDQNDFLLQQEQNNKDAEAFIEELNDKNSKLRKKLIDLTDLIALRKNELATLKKTVENVATALQDERRKNRQANIEKDEKTKALENGVKIHAELVLKLERFKDKNFGAIERLRQLEEMIEGEEKQIKLMDAEIARLSSTLFRSQQQLYSVQDEAKSLHMSVRNLENVIIVLLKNNKDKEKELFRETGIVYNMDLNIQTLEIRIETMRGSNKVEIDDDIESKIITCEEQLNLKTKNRNLLQIQVTKIEDDMRKLTMSLSTASKTAERLGNQVKEKQLFLVGGEKRLKLCTTENQERLVEQSILNMRVRQLEKEIEKQCDRVYNLEKHKMDLELMMNERLVDINMQRDLLLVKRKHLNEEITQLRADIGERNIKIEQWIKRYEAALDLLGKNEDGTLVTATQIKLQTAQEKAVLLKEGNDLNDNVIQAESDIKAMENTLRLINYSNDTYKKSFGTLDAESPQLIELNRLQEKYCKCINRLRSFRILMEDKVEQVKILNDQHMLLEKIAEEVTRARLDSNDGLLKIHKELMDQNVKIERANRDVKCAMKSARSKINDIDFIAAYEHDLQLKESEERNISALQQISDLVDAHPEMEPAVTKYLFEKGLTIPQPSTNRTRSQTSVKSYRSDRSDGSELSIKSLNINSATCRTTERTPCCSSESESIRSCTRLSVVQIGFPNETNGSIQRQSSKSTSTVCSIPSRRRPCKPSATKK